MIDDIMIYDMRNRRQHSSMDPRFENKRIIDVDNLFCHRWQDDRLTDGKPFGLKVRMVLRSFRACCG